MDRTVRTGQMGWLIDWIVHTCAADGLAQRYTPGSTMENKWGTCMSDGPACFELITAILSMGQGSTGSCRVDSWFDLVDNDPQTVKRSMASKSTGLMSNFDEQLLLVGDPESNFSPPSSCVEQAHITLVQSTMHTLLSLDSSHDQTSHLCLLRSHTQLQRHCCTRCKCHSTTRQDFSTTTRHYSRQVEGMHRIRRGGLAST